MTMVKIKNSARIHDIVYSKDYTQQRLDRLRNKALIPRNKLKEAEYLYMH